MNPRDAAAPPRIGRGDSYKPGTYEVIHEFGAEGATGIDPVADLLEAPDGMMYGTATGGGLPQGDFTRGVLYQLAPSGRVGVLKTFYDGSDGRCRRPASRSAPTAASMGRPTVAMPVWGPLPLSARCAGDPGTPPRRASSYSTVALPWVAPGSP